VRSALSGKIDLHFYSPNVDFSHGEYEVTITKIDPPYPVTYEDDADDLPW